MKKHLTKLCFTTLGGLLLLGVVNANAATYWVSTEGNNGNNCTSKVTACGSLGGALEKAVNPGDIVNITSGVHTAVHENCAWFSTPGLGCLRGSGTQSNPIVIQAAPGDEGSAVLDGQGSRLGIQISSYDYITIRNLEIRNTAENGIISQGGRPTSIAINDNTGLSVGIVIENNYIHDVVSIGGGANPGGVRLDGGKNWIIRNNRIANVCGGPEGCSYINAGCIYSYVVINALVENNVCTNSGALVHWKDSVVDQFDKPTHIGSVVRYNIGHDLKYGFYVSHGDANPESSNHTVTHNIIYNVDNCMQLNTATSDGAQSVNYIWEHNTCDGAQVGIYSTSAQVVSSQGNIFTDVALDIYRFANNSTAQLDGSNYNLFAPRFTRSNMSNPQATHIYSSLSQWRTVTPNSNLSINVTNPDINSLEVSKSSLFNNVSIRDYTLSASSPARAMMPDGTNAGAYQTGKEVIGLIGGYPEFSSNLTSPPNPPAALNAVTRSQ